MCNLRKADHIVSVLFCAELTRGSFAYIQSFCFSYCLAPFTTFIPSSFQFPNIQSDSTFEKNINVF